jgi:hypothetical protein
VVATGKFGVILVDGTSQPIEAAPNAAGKMQAVRSSGQAYQGSSPGDSIA